jgi:hypothetical protein
MASNGLTSRAGKGKCRICHRVRNTQTGVKAVGEVHHGFATGYIWECINIEECENVAIERASSCRPDSDHIAMELRRGRLKKYECYV